MHTAPSSNKLVSSRRMVAHHPYIGALALSILFLIVLLLIRGLFALISRWVHLPFLPENLIGESLLAIFIAVLVTLAGWWYETGFTSGLDRHTPLICLGAILLIGLPFLASLHLLIGKGSLSLMLMAIVVTLLVGFVEEGFFRGWLVPILVPKGVLKYIILSSILFAIMHSINLLVGFPLSYVIGQMLAALGIGVLFATIRLRTGSIWPTILLHALRDVAGLFLLAIDPKLVLTSSLNLAIIVNSTYCLLFILNAAILLRPSKIRNLRLKNTPPASDPILQESGSGYTNSI